MSSTPRKMKFLLCSVLLLAIVATGIAKPMSKDDAGKSSYSTLFSLICLALYINLSCALILFTIDPQEQYAKYAAMTPDELDEELAKLHKQLDENEAALQEYEGA